MGRGHETLTKNPKGTKRHSRRGQPSVLSSVALLAKEEALPRPPWRFWQRWLAKEEALLTKEGNP